MTLFDTREQGFEQMFAHDEEARFRALAKRNRLLGHWAASQLGLSGRTADAYSDEIGGTLASRATDDHLVEMILADFEANGVRVSEQEIRERMAEMMATAITEVRSSPW